jgi:protein KTI12
VHVGTPVERAREINEARLKQRDKRDADANAKDVIPETRAQADEEPYDPSTWENLVFRHEEPNPMARWDSPLFTVLWDDSSPPFDAIWTALIGSTDGKTKVVVRPNQATVLKPSAGEDYLYTLDRATQEVLGAIKVWMGDHVGEVGGVVEIDDGKGEVDGDDRRKDGDASGSGNGKGGLVVELPVGKEVGLAALQRLRRQFIAMNRQNSVPVARIKETFVGYLNDSFQAA